MFFTLILNSEKHFGIILCFHLWLCPWDICPEMLLQVCAGYLPLPTPPLLYFSSSCFYRLHFQDPLPFGIWWVAWEAIRGPKEREVWAFLLWDTGCMLLHISHPASFLGGSSSTSPAFTGFHEIIFNLCPFTLLLFSRCLSIPCLPP